MKTWVKSLSFFLLLVPQLQGKAQPYYVEEFEQYKNIDPIEHPFIIHNSVGEYYLSGIGTNTMLYDEQQLPIIAGDGKGIFLSKFSQDGSPIWTIFENAGPSNNESIVRDIAVDGHGNIIIGGIFTFSISFDTLMLVTQSYSQYTGFVAKFSPEGRIITLTALVAAINNTTTFVTSVSADYFGNVYFGGHYGAYNLFIGDTVRSDIPPSILWGKITSDGQIAWIREAGKSDGRRGAAVKANPLGNLYIFGNIIPDFEDNFIDDTLSMRGAGFLAKYNTNGERLWLRTTEKGYLNLPDLPNGQNINIQDDKVSITGVMQNINDTVRFGGLEIVYNTTAPYNNSAFMMLFDEDGNGLWIKEVYRMLYNTPVLTTHFQGNDILLCASTFSPYIPHFESFIYHNDYSPYVFVYDVQTGQFKKLYNLDFPFSTELSYAIIYSMSIFYQTILMTGSYNYSTSPIINHFIASSIPSKILVPSIEQLQATWEVFPNPSYGLVKIRSLDQSFLHQLSIYDLHGRAVLSEMPATNSSIELELSHLPGGLYFIHLETNKGSLVKELILNR